MNIAPTLRGGCHCGRLRVAYSTAIDPSTVEPRACDCSFCEKHGAAYVSDASGQLSITVAEPRDLRRYRQGSNAAEFLICGQCGVLVAVVFEHAARLYGAVNARCLDASAGLGAVVPASPQWLAAEEKVARWLRLWVPDVQLVTGASPPRGSA